ncbi:MAG: DUF2252 domain-containing protein, partial [Actinomycetes bacterium]
VEHPDRATRIADGRAARERRPRSAHAGWTPAPDRSHPVDLLRSQEATRVADLIPIRHERMLVSPFTFYRGAAILMANDLASRPDTGLTVQLCGDAHVANFGGFLAPDRSFVFDMNDFDETHTGPFEWDIYRLATSMMLAADGIGLSAGRARDIVRNCVQAYRVAMRGFAQMPNLDVWYARLDLAQVFEEANQRISQAQRLRLGSNVDRAKDKNSLRAFTKLTEVVDGEPRFRSDPPLIVPVRDMMADNPNLDVTGWIQDRIRGYRQSLQSDRRHLLEQYRMVDAARKVVGVGSVGTRCWIVLMLGCDANDPLILQVKEAQASVLETHTGASVFPEHGQRVVEGQRLLQAASDVMLGWFNTTTISGGEAEFYARQLWDGKLTVDLGQIRPRPLNVLGELCGWTLARGHARSGDRTAINAYLGNKSTFDDAIVAFAEDYVLQNAADYEMSRTLLGGAA